MPGSTILADGAPEEHQAVVIAARRTPVVRANGALRDVPVHRLLAPVLVALLEELTISGAEVDDVLIGNAVGGGGNVARLALLEAGLPAHVPGITVDRQCGSGLDAIVLASRLVAGGGNPLYLAGGAESVSTAPLRATRNSDGEPEFYARARFSPDTLGDPDMGVAAENVAREYGISRQEQDVFALASHARALEAQASGAFDRERVRVPAATGHVEVDDGPRRGLTARVLERFPAAFVPGGTVTAGNSCFDADAASAVVVTSVARARELGAVDGLLVEGTDTAGVDPHLLGMGAAAAAERLLRNRHMTAESLDLVEFNEAFASQTLACLARLGIAAGRANPDGGALALGHAYGASGAVLVTRLLAQARKTPGRESRALAMISGAGGLGTAALFRYTRLSPTKWQ
ncbi:thiolase family protein [Pseudarthrobacter sp. J75]|uniref:thiolase family protein n=1 Tax=unclassified Pseudarthrobacter TaxID=2647000 RepID=UPI002E81D8A6|nr:MULTISPECIES: thiolase family protein [unclassified Pseudarthrobacter]MEE2523064.1 thiolase family protein [Pseudarthrobacter sp. J47]MEE2529747.1 thiolase family protein [Pseudarthrobacter sp. J75]